MNHRSTGNDESTGCEGRDIDGLADTDIADLQDDAAIHSTSGSAARTTRRSRGPSSQRLARPGSSERDTDLSSQSRTPSYPGMGTAYAQSLPVEDAERYDMLGEYARGGLGRVMQARDERLGRTVAIKELLRRSRLAESLFVREALITARLQHPGIVPVHEAGRWPSGEPFYVMKLVSGQSLMVLIRETESLAERLALLPHVIAVIDTLAYAHNEGVIHRDIKPANVIVGDFGETVVVDWGLARDEKQPVPLAQNLVEMELAALADPAHDSTTVWLSVGNYSVSGKVIGTPAYMAPEQARGEEVGAKADVYALGALLYELLAGTAPYTGKEPQVVLDRVLAGPPAPLVEQDRHIPRDLIAIVDKAMARDPGQRYPSAVELAEDLRRFHTGKLVSAHHYSTWTLVRRWLWRHRSPALVAATALMVLAVMAVVGVDRIVTEKNHAQAQRAAAETRGADLVLLQAQSSLLRDPTAAMAWLAQVLEPGPIDDDRFHEARQHYDEAVARGVARHVIPHGDGIERTIPTPDGEFLISASRDGALRLIDPERGTARILYRSDNAHFFSVALSPDRRWLAAGTRKGVIHLLALDGEYRVRAARQLDGHRRHVRVVRFTADAHLVSISLDHQIRVWDVASGEDRAMYHYASYAASSEDGEWLARGMNDDNLTLIDAISGDEIWQATLRRPEPIAPGEVPGPGPRATPLGPMAFSPDRRQLAVHGQDGVVRLVDTENGSVRELGRIDAPLWMTPIAFSPTGRWLATTDEESAIQLWNVETGERERIWRGHSRPVFALTFTDDERFLGSTSDDATARVWELASDHVREFVGHTDDVSQIAFHDGGATISTASFDGTVRIWPFEPRAVQQLAMPGPVWAVRFDDSGDLVTVGEDLELRQIALRDEQRQELGGLDLDALAIDTAQTMTTGKFLSQLKRRPTPQIVIWNLQDGTRQIRTGFDSIARKVVFSQDDSTMVSLHQDHSIRVWSVEGGEPQLIRPESAVCGIAVSRDGALLATTSSSRAEVLDLASKRVVGRFATPDDIACLPGKPGRHVVFSGDGSWVAVSGSGRGVALWHPSSGSARELDTRGQRVFQLASSPDGRLLAATIESREVVVWDAHSGQERHVGKHEDHVYHVTFSPRGNLLASASVDGTVGVWNPTTDELRVLRGHSDEVIRVAFSRDSSLLVSSSLDRTMWIWQLADLVIPDAEVLRDRVAGATSAVIDDDNRVRTVDIARNPPSRAASL